MKLRKVLQGLLCCQVCLLCADEISDLIHSCLSAEKIRTSDLEQLGTSPFTVFYVVSGNTHVR